MPILVTDANYDHTYAIVKSLRKKGLIIDVLGPRPRSICFMSKYVRMRYLVKWGSEEEYVNSLMKILKRHNYELLIPVGARSVSVVSKYKDMISKYVKVIVPDYNQYMKVSNRKELYEVAKRLNIPVPFTCYPSSLSDLKKCVKDVGLPVVIKDLYERGGGSVYGVAYTIEDAIKLYVYATKRLKRKILVQELIEGKFNYGFTALYYKGTCKRIFMFKEIRSYPPFGGSATLAQSVFIRELKDMSIKLLNTLSWNGVVHVEFKEHRDGKLFLMEVNPKFWASLELAIVSGVDYPYYLYLLSKNIDIGYSEKYKIGIMMQWIPREVLHLRSNPRAFRAIVLDILNPRIKKCASFNDILVHCIRLASSIRGG